MQHFNPAITRVLTMYKFSSFIFNMIKPFKVLVLLFIMPWDFGIIAQIS